MPKMTDEELQSLVDAEFTAAMGMSGGEISRERAKAWDFYMARLLGNEVEGQSQVVTSDVADVVDSIMPSLLRIFTTADNLIDFDPVGKEDVPQAQQESDYVNHVFFKKNDAFLILYSWFFDALVQKNGVVKAWWDESEIVTTETYQGLNETELAELMDDEELEALEQDKRIGETVIELPTPDGVQQIIGPDTVYDVEFRRVSKGGRVCVENVPPDEYRISADARSVDPSGARMVGHEREVTRSELLDMGFDKSIVDDLPAHGGDLLRNEEQIARRDKTDEQNDATRDPSQDKILLREAYIRVDYDGDGRAELRQVFTAGSELLSNEEADRQPFHVISPQPLPHKHFGRATAEKVMDIQEVNTTLVRQILDNLYHSNNPSHAVWEQGIGDNTLDDLLSTRVGSIKRFARPVSESYQSISVPFTAGQTFPMLEYWDKAKRDRTGVSSDGEGLSPEALKNIQQSVLANAVDMSKMKIEAIARIFAETGLKSLFRHIHELLLKHQKKAEIVRLRNEWVQVDPQAWRSRLDLTVKIGLGIGTREQNLLHLNAIWEKQIGIVQAGGFGSLVSPMNVYNTCAELVRNANLKDPTMFFTPVEEIPPQGGGEQEKMLQAQIQLAQQQMQLEVQKLQLGQQKDAAAHQREVAKLQQTAKEHGDKMTVEMEKLANQLTDMELEYGQNVPGAKV